MNQQNVSVQYSRAKLPFCSQSLRERVATYTKFWEYAPFRFQMRCFIRMQSDQAPAIYSYTSGSHGRVIVDSTKCVSASFSQGGAWYFIPPGCLQTESLERPTGPIKFEKSI